MNPNAAQFGCNTYSYTIDHTVEDCLRRLADFGFVELELMMYPGPLWPPDADAPRRAALRQLIARRELRATTLNMPNIDARDHRAGCRHGHSRFGRCAGPHGMRANEAA